MGFVSAGRTPTGASDAVRVREMAVGHAQQEIRTPDFPKDAMPLHTARLMADSRATLPTNEQLGRSSTAQEDVGLGDDILDRK